MRRRFSIINRAKGKLIANLEIKKPDYEVRGFQQVHAVRYIVLYYYTTSIAGLERGDPWLPKIPPGSATEMIYSTVVFAFKVNNLKQSVKGFYGGREGSADVAARPNYSGRSALRPFN